MPQDTLNRFVRTILQVVAAGGATAIFQAITDLVPMQYNALVAGIFMLIVTLAQNLAEDYGIIPKILKPDPMTVELVLEDEPRVL